MKYERRFTPAAVQRRANGQTTIVGHAAVFYDGTPATEYELYAGLVERVMPGAFNRAIHEDDVAALFNHNPDCILGRTTAGTCRLTTDDKGLRYEIDPPDTQAGRDVLVSLDRRDITGSSFGFVVRAQKWIDQEDGTTIRELHDVALYDVSPVVFPAYGGTSAGIRSAGEIEDVRAQLEQYRAERDEEDRDRRNRIIRLHELEGC